MSYGLPCYSGVSSAASPKEANKIYAIERARGTKIHCTSSAALQKHVCSIHGDKTLILLVCRENTLRAGSTLRGEESEKSKIDNYSIDIASIPLKMSPVLPEG